jgi:hypothetical protein
MHSSLDEHLYEINYSYFLMQTFKLTLALLLYKLLTQISLLF